MAAGAEVAAKKRPDAPPDLDYSLTAAAKNGEGGTIGLEPTRLLSLLRGLSSLTPPLQVVCKSLAETAPQRLHTL